MMFAQKALKKKVVCEPGRVSLVQVCRFCGFNTSIGDFLGSKEIGAYYKVLPKSWVGQKLTEQRQKAQKRKRW